jgi:hypothetical protein
MLCNTLSKCDDMSTLTQVSSAKQQVARSVLTALLYSAPIWICLYAPVSVADPDVWWHMRTAEWILQHHSFPHSDPFSVFGAGKPWQAYSWLFDITVLGLYRWLDLAGIMTYTCAMVFAITFVIHRMIRRLQPDFTKAILLTMAIMICMSRLYTPRSWLLTILLFALELDILLEARRTGETRRLLWLPPIFVLWANTHIQFIDGLVLLALASCESLIDRRRCPRVIYHRNLWAVSGACLLSTLITPYGVTIYKAAYQLGSQAGVMDKVSELQAIPFRSAGDFLLLFLTMAAVGALAWKQRFQPFETVLLVVAAAISFRSRRDVWFVAIVAGVILAAALRGRRENEPSRLAFATPLVFMATTALICIGVLLFHTNNARLRFVLARNMPVRAVEVIKERGYGGPLYNDYAWGGFMIWNLRMPVSIDGRAALHGDQRIDRSVATWGGSPDWASDPDLSSAGIVIAPIKTPLAQLLKTDSRFGLAFHDDVADVFISRRQAEAAARVSSSTSGTPSHPCNRPSPAGSPCAS